MDLLSYECKESEKNERDVHLKGQITDLQTVVFIAQIKVCGFGGGSLLLLSCPETDEGGHKLNSQQTLRKYGIEN